MSNIPGTTDLPAKSRAPAPSALSDVTIPSRTAIPDTQPSAARPVNTLPLLKSTHVLLRPPRTGWHEIGGEPKDVARISAAGPAVNVGESGQQSLVPYCSVRVGAVEQRSGYAAVAGEESRVRCAAADADIGEPSVTA